MWRAGAYERGVSADVAAYVELLTHRHGQLKDVRNDERYDEVIVCATYRFGHFLCTTSCCSTEWCPSFSADRTPHSQSALHGLVRGGPRPGGVPELAGARRHEQACRHGMLVLVVRSMRGWCS